MKNRIDNITESRQARFPFGWVRVFWSNGKVVGVELFDGHRNRRRKWASDRMLADAIERVIHTGNIPADFVLDLSGLSSFARRVLAGCAKIGFGKVLSYSELARMVGKPDAARAVGQVMAHNRFPLFFPCHRVVAKHGGLGGFTGGLVIKQRILEYEGWRVEEGRLVR